MVLLCLSRAPEKKENKGNNSSIPYLEKKETRWASCATEKYKISLEWEKKKWNPHKYKMEGRHAKAGASPLPATKIAAEKFIIRAYIKLD